MKNATIALLAALMLAWAPAVYAADNATEFGIEDDLSVLGSTGTLEDPDVEIKGFSVFGAVQGPNNIAASSGNVVIRGNLQVDATTYFGSSVTVAGYGVFTSTVQMTEGMLKYGNAVAGKVLKSGGNGYTYWGDDAGSGGSISGTPRRISMFRSGGEGVEDSPLHSDSANSLTVLTSSLTIQGYNGEGLGVTGAARIAGDLFVVGNSSLTVGTGLTTLGGALNVTGNTALTGSLSVNDIASFGAAPTKSTFTADGSLYLAEGSSITLGTGRITLPAVPLANYDAVNKLYVDTAVGGISGANGIWVRDADIHAVKLSTITDNVGIGIAAPDAKLHVSSANANASDMLVMVSSGTLATERLLTLDAAGDLYVKGDTQLGDDKTRKHGINRAAEDNVGLAVSGNGTSGSFAAKFYSDAAQNTLAAWIKKK